MTPGPWYYDIVGISDDHSNPTFICEIMNGRKRIAEHVAAEDAALIAEAPDLLAALKAAVDLMEQEDFATLTLVPKFRAVIAKAEGK